MKKIITIVFVLITIISCSKPAATNPPVTTAYFPKVKNIIATNCLSCHDPAGLWAGRPTDLTTDDKIVALAGTIKIAVAGPLSLTIHHMPQGGQLSQSDIDIIVAWFNAGGKATD